MDQVLKVTNAHANVMSVDVMISDIIAHRETSGATTRAARPICTVGLDVDSHCDIRGG